MSSDALQIEPLRSTHNRQTFSSGVEALDRYLKQSAGQQMRSKLASVYVAIYASEPGRVVGYYTLSAFAVETDRIRQTLQQNLPGYQLIPATMLGRLAVDKALQNQGVGRLLLADALRRAYIHASVVASLAVAVDAIDAGVAAWYERFGFLRYTDDPLQLMIPMKQIQRLVV